MHRLTQRLQFVQVATLSTLRKHLESIGVQDCRFKVEKVHHDRVTISCEDVHSGRKSYVILPSYPTGHQDDLPANPNVVLDPLEFVNVEGCAQRRVFAPLLGNELLEYYEKLHPDTEFSLTRCC